MNRRQFFATLLAAGFGTLEAQKELLRPARTIFVPPAGGWASCWDGVISIPDLAAIVQEVYSEGKSDAIFSEFVQARVDFAPPGVYRQNGEMLFLSPLPSGRGLITPKSPIAGL